jgi:DNA-binding transcriptional regulator LsrR (DeoR family)
LSDPAIIKTIQAWKRINTLILGIGAFPASPLLAASGNSIDQKNEIEIKNAGAVGEICLRYFDKDGRAMHPLIEERIIAIDYPLMNEAKRRIGVAGGVSKLNAIRAAIIGGWINVLITDSDVARLLLEPPRLKK